MDIASLVGMLVCLGLVLYGMINSAGGVSGLGYFLDPASALITFGGSVFATMMSQEHYTDFQTGQCQCT